MTRDPQGLVSDKTVAAFQRDGAVVLRQVFSQGWLERLSRGVELNLAHPGPLAIRYTDEGEPGRTSPPFREMGLELAPADRMPEDWFPVLWPPPEPADAGP